MSFFRFATKNMSSKILLVNFTEKEAETIKTLNIIVDRGFFSDVKKLTKEESIITSYGKQEEANDKFKPLDDIDFYFPLPVYEYNAVFINLNHNKILTKEFEDKLIKFTYDDRKNFTQYWLLRGKPVVIFLGDYQLNNLDNIGIPDISLQKVVNKDVSISCLDKDDLNEIASLCKNYKSQVVMPTNYYIHIDEKSSFNTQGSGYKQKYLLWNNNNEDLAIFIDYDKGYSSTGRPRILILPQFKNNILVVEKFLRILAKIRPKYLPELSQSDWVSSDDYYPLEVVDYNSKIEKLINIAQEKISFLKKQKEETKEKYKTLRGLIIESGDELKNSVLDVLKDIFNANVEDGDEKHGLSNEDIIINFDDHIILAEVKGVKSENPSPLFVGQVWKHISQNKDKNISQGALILNHDLETNPEDRSLAYKGEYEKALDDIYFIDTRVMFNLAIAIINYGMSTEDAKKRFFKLGRVEFNLNEYRESIKSNNIEK